MNKRLLVIVVLVLIVSAISFTRSFLGLIGTIPWHYGYSDVFNEDRINPLVAKKIPYLETPVEYPVITGFFIYLMWFFGRNLLGYAVLTGLFLTSAAIITVLYLDKLIGMFKIPNQRLFLYFIFAPSLLVFGIFNWDIIAVMFAVLALYYFYKEKYSLATIFLALGFNAKLFPILILPVMLVKANFRQAIKIALLFVATSILLNIYFVINSFDVWKITFLFHSLRETSQDSVWALTGLSAAAINILSLSSLLFSYAILIYYHKKYDFISLSFAFVLLFLIFNKIFSPQYVLWILPFVVLSQKIATKPFYMLEASNLIVFFSALNLLFASKAQIFLTISSTAFAGRTLIVAYIIYTTLNKANKY